MGIMLQLGEIRFEFSCTIGGHQLTRMHCAFHQSWKGDLECYHHEETINVKETDLLLCTSIHFSLCQLLQQRFASQGEEHLLPDFLNSCPTWQRSQIVSCQGCFHRRICAVKFPATVLVQPLLPPAPSSHGLELFPARAVDWGQFV